MLKALVVLLAVASLTSAFPNHWRDSTYMKEIRLQQNTGAQCDAVTRPAANVCQSARVINSATGRYSHVHVCPVDGNSQEVCINSKLPTCCQDRSELEASALECVSTSTLTVSGRNVNVKIYKNTEGENCLFLDDPDIVRCCTAATKFLECPPAPTDPPTPKPCIKERDVYFLLDATGSIGEELFCRFGYVMQLIVAAINPSGGSTGTRVESLLYGSHATNYKAMELFSVSDKCKTIVDSRLTQVVYEYYAVGHKIKDISEVTYKSVQATSTRAKQPMYSANLLIKEKSRHASVVIITDGRHQDKVVNERAALIKNADVLIAAGIGPEKEINEKDLAKLAPTDNIIYESDTEKVFKFSERIVNKMNQEGALCADEAKRIIDALEKTTNVNTYCSTSCMFSDPQNQQNCNIEHPKCGDETLQIQSKDARVMSTSKELEEEVLKEEILAAVERVIEEQEQRNNHVDLEDYMIRLSD